MSGDILYPSINLYSSISSLGASVGFGVLFQFALHSDLVPELFELLFEIFSEDVLNGGGGPSPRMETVSFLKGPRQH